MSTSSLEFKSEQLRPNLVKLFTELSSRPEKADEFVSNPSGIALENLLPETSQSITPQEISTSNKFLFSALKNQRFRAWIANFQKSVDAELANPKNAGKSVEEIIPREKALKEVAQALLESGDRDLLASFTDALSASRGPTVAGPVHHDVAIVTAIAVALVVVISAIDVTPRVAPHNLTFTAPDLKAMADALIKKASSI